MTRTQQALPVVALFAFAYAILGNYVALPGYIRFLERGGTSSGSTADADFIIGATRTILWMYAFNLGAMSLFGYSLLKQRSAYLRHGLVLCTLWLVFWSIPSLPRMPAPFYVVLGSVIVLAIVAVHVREFRVSKDLSGFLMATAILFFAMATWDICGLGSTGRILHPDAVVLDRSQTLLRTQTTKLMIAMGIAWGCLAVSQRRDISALQVKS